MAGEMLLWHYTPGINFKLIAASGVIKTAFEGVPDGERFAVWFSSNQYWEATVDKLCETVDNKVVQLTMQQTKDRYDGLYRIGVSRETAPVSWRQHKQSGGMTAEWARTMEQSGRRQGAEPGQWYCSYEPVPREKWVAVERMDDSGRWMAVEL